MTTHTLDVPGVGSVPVTITTAGSGHLILLLHGGGGPQTVAGFTQILAEWRHARVIAPVHPGFGGTPRPDALADVRGLARTYAALLDALDVDDVTVVGNSIGGWVAAELALLGSPRVSSCVIVDGVGIDVPEHPGADFFSLTLDEVADLAYYEPDRFRINPATLPPGLAAQLPGNRAALAAYAGESMSDPTLARRLAEVSTPTLVVWGEADRIKDPEYGRAFAAAIPSADFVLMERTGHMPQLETPERLAQIVGDFADAHSARRPVA